MVGRVSFVYQSFRYQNILKGSLNNWITAQDKVSAQRELLNPEDNSTRYVAAYSLQRTIDDMATFISNAATALGWLKTADTQVEELTKLMQEAREAAVAGNAGTLSKEASDALAGKVNELYNRLYDIANSSYMGRYIFAGFKTDTPPFQDMKSAVNAISQEYGNGGNVSTGNIYGDLKEIASGEYTAQVRVHNNKCYLSLYDKHGRPVMIDSNGSDDTLKSSNNMVYEMSFEYEPGKVIDTGVGVSITLPNDESSAFSGLKYTFNYTAGQLATYFGDDGVLYNMIGYKQRVAMNFPGSELFMQNNKTIRFGQLLTSSGLYVNASTKFSELKSANTSLGDSIKLKGLDYLGRPLGSASLVGSESVQYDLRYATKEERTLTIGHGGSFYQIEIPAQSYKDMDELLTQVNRSLTTAKYAGSQNAVDYVNVDGIESNHALEIANNINVTNHEVDLSDKIKVSRDGDRLSFTTTATGDHTILSVTGSANNKLGFDAKTIAAVGKDTTFELGYDFSSSGIQSLNVTHSGIAVTEMTGASGFSFEINGVTVNVPSIAAGSSNEDMEFAINRALRSAGFGDTISTKITNAPTGPIDMTFSMQNTNFDKDTHLSSSVSFPSLTEFVMETPYRNIPAFPKEQNIGDLMDFVENLYGGTVDVYLDGEGRINVQDKRSGASASSLQFLENNQGISLPIGNNHVVVSGNYNGFADDEWTVQYTTTASGSGGLDVQLRVVNKNGTEIVNETINNYTGGTIELKNGVKLVIDEQIVTNQSFKLNLTANSSLNLGDPSIVTDGTNGNIFTNLKNLYDALHIGIGLDGADAPSSWREPGKSTAIPSFVNGFGANYNSKWTYNVEALNGKTDFYIQNEFIHKTGKLNHNADVIAADPTLDFKVQWFDDKTGTMKAETISVPIGGATSNAEIAQMVQDYIKTNHPAIDSAGIRVVYQDGRMEFQSGSGARSVNVIPQDEAAIYLMGLENNPPVGETSLKTDYSAPNNASFNIKYFNGANWQTQLVTLNSAYADESAVIAAINAQLGGTGVTAAVTSEGRLTFNGGTTPFYYDLVSDPSSALGMGNNIQKYIGGNTRVSLDTTNYTVEQRTLTFKYGNNSYNIELPAKEYGSMGEMVDEINSLIAAKGFGADVRAVVYGEGIGFESLTADPISIEGDYAGTLGFKKMGDNVTVRVTDETGKIIQNVNMNTASTYYEVADGMKLAFDAGSLFATESFTGTVGSGVSIELGIIDKIENQILSVLTSAGTRISRTESTQSFSTTLSTAAENQKASYLGSTSADIIALTTKMEMAQSAYEYAISIVTKSMSFSILDYF